MALTVLAEMYVRVVNGSRSLEMADGVISEAANPPDITPRSVREAESKDDGLNNENMLEMAGHCVLDIVSRVDCAAETVLDDIDDQSLDDIPQAKFFI